MNNNNILLITNDSVTENIIRNNLALLRQNDKLLVCDTTAAKKALDDDICSLVILHETEDEEYTLKLIKSVKSNKPEAQIILLLNEKNQNLTVAAYDIGITDFMYTTDEPYEMLIKSINCLKLRVLKENLQNDVIFLEKYEIVNNKNGFYEYKAIKEVFADLAENQSIKNGFLAVLSLDEKIKTKVSTNRLSLVIKNNKRDDDIVVAARGGKFYIILPNTDLIGTKQFINKLQEQMGAEFVLRAGLAKIGINSFDILDKNVNDGLISAVQNDLSYVCLENNQKDTWLIDDKQVESTKKYKFFNKLYKEKFDNVITPLFYRFQKEYEYSLTNTSVTQYANNIESVFCLKTSGLTSELVIRYNGYAKFNIEITHSGLNSAENSKIELPMNEMTEKYLTSLFKKLKKEYKQSVSITDLR